MCAESESDLERLQRQVEKAKTLIHQSAIKVEELEASMRNICDIKKRFILFPRSAKRDSADGINASPGGEPRFLKAA